MSQIKLQVYDPPMCCSTGLCGPDVKPELVTLVNDLKWLEQQGITVERFNLAAHPAAFINNEAVKKALKDEGNAVLPLIVVNDLIVSKGVYPSRSQLMKFTGIENDKESVESSEAAKSETTAACGPGCCCNGGTSSSGKKFRTIVCLIILLAVVGIFIYKANTRQPASNTSEVKNSQAFAIVPAGSNVKAATDTIPAAKSTTEISKKIGVYLDSLSNLNKVALNQDAVFIFIPAAKVEAVDVTTNNAVLAAQKALADKKINLGLYTLSSTSSDYAMIAAKVQAPAVLVSVKGKGIAAVSGEITETKLLQAFMASARSGGGCGSSSGGCGPSGCN